MPVSLIYSDPMSGGSLYQCAAKDIPGTPPNFTYSWQQQETTMAIATKLQRTGVKALIIASKEYTPHIFNGFTYVRNIAVATDFDPQNDPTGLLEKMQEAAFLAANVVAEGQRALIASWDGLNRSSFICGLILRFLTDCSAADAIGQIKDQRGFDAFSNQTFKNLLETTTVGVPDVGKNKKNR